MLTVYAYQGCSTCRDAIKWLQQNKTEFSLKAIRETPPSVAELANMLRAYDGDLRRLFNVSGQDYRALGLKDKLPTMSTEEALALLASNGNLIKRPFAIGNKPAVHLVGFKQPEWEAALLPK